MPKQYAFFINSAVCAGCKTCQVTCKDKHDLDLGIRWRRVYEVTGGEWVAEGHVWLPNVYAYNLSMSCNHCQNPVCVSVCPTGAMHKREDGIVAVNADTCVGCKLCAWACPYGAPQYNAKTGVMTKCDFCADEVDAGRPPACVAACPMRGLDFGELDDLRKKYGSLDQVYPMPPADQTQPSVIIKPHRHAKQARNDNAAITNREEI